MKFMRIVLSPIGLLFVACCSGTSLSARSLETPIKPVKLVVNVVNRSLLAGETAKINVSLRDSQNHAAKADKDYQIRLEVQLGHGKPDVREATVSSGSDSTQIMIPLPDPGTYRVLASHPDLREGDTYIQVRAAKKTSALWQPVLLLKNKPRAPAELKLVISDAGVIANEQDEAQLEAFLSEPAPFDIKLMFHVDKGVTLTPNPLTIPAGERSAKGSLTSKTPGVLKVSYEGCEPTNSVGKVDKPENEATFKAPITWIKLSPSSPQIQVETKLPVQVELLDHHMKAIAADEDINVSLRGDPEGEFEPNPVPIPSGKDSASTSFTTNKIGTFQLTANAKGLNNEPVEVTARFPGLAFASALIGGALGAFMAALRQAHPSRQQRLIRVVSGCAVASIFFWACALHVVGLTLCHGVYTWQWSLIGSLFVGYIGIELLEVFRRIIIPA